MDIQTMVHNAVDADRAEKLKNSDQMTLGELIAHLEGAKLTYETTEGYGDTKKKVTKGKRVVFDFEYLFPTGLTSWRGIYKELSLTFSGSDFGKEESMTGEEFLKLLKSAIGETYTGWKGGDFTMGKTTPLWVANIGNSGETAVVGIEIDDWGITLITGQREC